MFGQFVSDRCAELWEWTQGWLWLNALCSLFQELFEVLMQENSDVGQRREHKEFLCLKNKEYTVFIIQWVTPAAWPR